MSRKVQAGPHTIWIDNFSKVYGMKIPSVDLGSWRDCLWTGVAIKKYNGPELNMRLVTKPDGTTETAMPDDMFAYVDQLKAMFQEHRVTGSYQAKCLTARWRVNNVPLKPDHRRVNNDKWRAALRSGLDKLEHMYPKELIALNIGGNAGLGKIMRVHYEENKQHLDGQCNHYSALNTDENIFMRILKVKQK
jgi:hypothetical protein